MNKQAIGKVNDETLYFITPQSNEERERLNIQDGVSGFWETESGIRFDDPADFLKMANVIFSGSGPGVLSSMTSEQNARQLHVNIFNQQREMVLDFAAEKRKEFSRHPNPEIRAKLLQGLESIERIYANRKKPLVDLDGVFRPDEKTKELIYGKFIDPVE